MKRRGRGVTADLGGDPDEQRSLVTLVAALSSLGPGRLDGVALGMEEAEPWKNDVACGIITWQQASDRRDGWAWRNGGVSIT